MTCTGKLKPNGLSVAIKGPVNSRIISIELLSITLKLLLTSSQHCGGFSRPTICHSILSLGLWGIPFQFSDRVLVHWGSTELPAWSCVGGHTSKLGQLPWCVWVMLLVDVFLHLPTLFYCVGFMPTRFCSTIHCSPDPQLTGFTLPQ